MIGKTTSHCQVNCFTLAADAAEAEEDNEVENRL